MSFIMPKTTLIFIATIFLFYFAPTLAGKPHHITFRLLNLYPEGHTWDPIAQHFLVGSLHHRSIFAVSDTGVVETLISDPSLPPNCSILGLTVDSPNRRLFATVHSGPPYPPFSALAAYDLRSRTRLFLAELNGEIAGEGQLANDVAVDFDGNAYVTNSAGNFIWKVNAQGEPSIFSKSPAFKSYPVLDPNSPFSSCGLNGIVYVSEGYLLVGQSNTGKLFKVDIEDGTARAVSLKENLTFADGMAIRSDGVVVAVSTHTLWFVKSVNNWGEGVVYDKTALDVEGFATSVAIGRKDRVYVLYGHVVEGIMGGSGRELFEIEEVRAETESGKVSIWACVLIGLGLAYFVFWKFQMGRFVKNMNKKTA